MKNSLAFAVLRGDRRHTLLCGLLRRDGHAVVEVGSLEEARMPALLPQGAVVIAPAVPPGVAEALAARGIGSVAYQQDAACVLAHAVITAENAIQVAMERLDSVLSQCRILVIGYGRIGKALSGMLRGLGCRVTVGARRPEDLAAIALAGHETTETMALDTCLGRMDLVFNTVPAPVLSGALLALLPPSALVIDLASKPGGVDFEAASALGVTAIHALALPGALTPLSSARAIRDTVYRILAREGLKEGLIYEES